MEELKNSQTYEPPKGCSHIHTRRESRRALRRIARRTQVKGAHHWIVCTRSKSNVKKLRHYWRHALKWRRTYAGYWTLERRKLPWGILVRLTRLRGCESGGRYHIAGHHFGAYQYLYGTWARAQAFYGAPRRYWTVGPHLASPAHQDAVTGRFWPSHYGEWACKA